MPNPNSKIEKRLDKISWAADEALDSLDGLLSLEPYLSKDVKIDIKNIERCLNKIMDLSYEGCLEVPADNKEKKKKK